ncbi:MAG: Hsp20/alpha crystallin family protein [Flaviaesturariibacter sp.]|nr:Hsp20/alpha crystallin family protein [Flaviaesturariibacter sp.]
MSIAKRNPLLSTGLFDDFFTRDIMHWGVGNNSTTDTTIPAVNIRETADNFEVEMAAPGMTRDDFRIELDGNQLTITSEKKSESHDNGTGRYTRREFSYQSFRRVFQLPKDVVDVDRIGARYENGLLQLTIPKREEVKKAAPRMIQIQ